MMSDEELDRWCYENWLRIPSEKREECLDHLQASIPLDVALSWKMNGFSFTGFHFYGGMSVRNILRDVLLDKDLPKVWYVDQQDYFQNWDDFYTGAIQDFLERVPEVH